MTVRDRVRRTQRSLELVHGGAALFWSAAALIGALVIGSVAAALTRLPPLVESAVPFIAVIAGLATFAALAWRTRFAWSFDRVALWIEERAPHLRYAVVTAIDPRYSESMDLIVRPLVAEVDMQSHVRRAATRNTLPALVALIVATIAFLMIPAAWKERVNAPVTFGGGAPSTPTPIGNRLVPLTGRVTPPEYSGRRSISLSEPSTIRELQGSRVMLTGRGDPSGIQATLTGADGRAKNLAITGGGSGWVLSLAMTDTAPALLRLLDRKYNRLIITDPQVDETPTATLRLPIHDTTLKVVSGNLQLAADLADEVGLAKARFEYIISSGSEENFTFREGTLADRNLGGSTRGRLEISVPFESFKLGEGDRLSVRAVVWDINTLTGPGKGTSETRTIRVATKGEYDSVSINRAPASADTAMMSLRMLIIATEKLKADKPKMERPAFVSEARKLGGQGEIIRRKIQQIIDETTGGGQIAPDTLLTTALNSMWDATRELYVASPDAALPPMYIAYKALQALRNTKRYYIRGITKPIIVNIDRVRLKGGTDTGTAIPRLARGEQKSNLDQLRRAYAETIRLLRLSPDSALNGLMMMRVLSLRASPPLAAALGDAVSALQSGKDATGALLRARRVLEGSTIKLDSLPVWSGAW